MFKVCSPCATQKSQSFLHASCVHRQSFHSTHPQKIAKKNFCASCCTTSRTNFVREALSACESPSSEPSHATQHRVPRNLLPLVLWKAPVTEECIPDLQGTKRAAPRVPLDASQTLREPSRTIQCGHKVHSPFCEDCFLTELLKKREHESLPCGAATDARVDCFLGGLPAMLSLPTVGSSTPKTTVAFSSQQGSPVSVWRW